MLIDWDMTVTLSAMPIANLQHSAPPAFTGTLRSAVRKAMEWPHDAAPTIFLEGKVNGKVTLDRGEIAELAEQLNPV